MVTIKVKRLTETAKMPTKAHETDACFDLYLDLQDADEITIFPKQTLKMHSGIATEIPPGYFAAIFPRSGLGINKGLRLPNCTGIIDADYRGEWVIALTNDSDTSWTLKKGDRISQFAVLPVLDTFLQEVDELNETERGTGGLGSTGLK